MSEPLNVLSLFAGIGGLDLGLERAGMRVVGQVELDPYCRAVLARHWPDVPQHEDVRTAADWWLSIERPRVDVICGGFPCQDISVAGRRAGIIDGERSGLWTYFAHTIRRIRPRYVLVENVPRVLVRGNDGVIPAEVIAADLATLGYDLRWDCIPASALGAPHQRDRWLGIARAEREPLRLKPVTVAGRDGAALLTVDGPPRHLADSTSDGRRQGWPGGPAGSGAYWSAVWPQALAHAEGERRRPSGQGGAEEAGTDAVARSAGQRNSDHTWATEPDVGRVVNGVPNRLDRLAEDDRIRALGNAVVPQVAEYAGRLIVAHASAVAA